MSWLKGLFGPSPEEIKTLLAKNHEIIDVRTPSEFAGGHMEGAINIPLQSIHRHLDDIAKLPQPVILCCKSGTRSGMAKSILKKQGIDCINGGSWQSVAKLKD